MKKKSFILHLENNPEDQVLIPVESFDYAIRIDGATGVSVAGEQFYVKESIAEVANLYEETEE